MNAQSFDFLSALESEDEVYFDYNYEEFDHYAYLDSSIILESFIGVQNFHKDSIQYNYPNISYYFTVDKIGKFIKRTFFDTVSVEDQTLQYSVVLSENQDMDTVGASAQLTGWIFEDILLTSIIDSMDTIPIYPYSKIFRNYFPENDTSLFTRNDTLIIHYRPTTSNYYDSYFSIDYYLKKNRGLRYYSKYYWYYGAGFSESYKWRGQAIIDNVEQSDQTIMNKFALLQNYPNPFNPITNISYTIPKSSFVKIIVYDILGNEVKILVNENRSKGEHKIQFDASSLSSGIYYYRIFYNDDSITRKLMLLK